MKRFFGSLWYRFNHAVLIFRTKGKIGKLSLLVTYARILVKNALLVEILGLELKREKLFGYKMNFFNYSLFIYLFEEIFIKNEYFFIATTEKPFILDCGSNIGMSILFFKINHPGSHIVAFEPDAQTFKMLELNIRQNRLADVAIHNKALSNSKKDIKFFYDPQGPGSLTMSVKKEREDKNYQVVKAALLSEFIRSKVDFLKMDIEGAENMVIPELESHHRFKFIQQMVLEYHHHMDKEKDELAKMLAIFEKNHMGYQITSILKPPVAAKKFQDLLISVYKK